MNLQNLDTVNEPPCSVVGQLLKTTPNNKGTKTGNTGTKAVQKENRLKDVTPTLAAKGAT